MQNSKGPCTISDQFVAHLLVSITDRLFMEEVYWYVNLRWGETSV